jgi:undecaprenyl-phosphate galactose phosphotransferase
MAKDYTISYAGAPVRAPGRLRHWLATIVLAFSDGLVFALAWLVFRWGQHVPAFLLFRSKTEAGPTIDSFMVLALFFVIMRYLTGDYSKRVPFWDLTRRSTTTLLAVAGLDLLFVFLTGQDALWLRFGLMWGLLVVALPLSREATRHVLSAAGLWRIPTLLVSEGAHVDDVLGELDHSIALGFDVRHVVLIDDGAPATPIVGRNVSAMSDIPAIARLAVRSGCPQTVLAMEDLQQMSEVMRYLIGLNMDVAVLPPIWRLPMFGMSVSFFFGRDVVLLQMRNNLARIPSRIIKRLVDIVGAITALILMAPVFLVISLLVKRDDPGPAFFVQTRVGRHGKEFPCLKFRTMKVDAERILSSWETEQPQLMAQYRASNFKLADDPRVTRMGRWLRRTSLDELPQLINVLLGHMSLSGPRPLLPREIARYGVAIELYQKVRPGLTGLWQINGRSNTTFNDRITYDEWYIKNWSLWYDIVILLRTLRVVLTDRSGAF